MLGKKWWILGASTLLLIAPAAMAEEEFSFSASGIWALIVAYFEEGGYVDPNGGRAAACQGDTGACVDPYGRALPGREGSGLDPHGGFAAGDGGAFIDPLGKSLDHGSAMDPNGQSSVTGDKGMGLDPNG